MALLVDSLAEFVADRIDVLHRTGQEEPSRPRPILFGILLQYLGRIILRIQADRIDEDRATYAVAKAPLNLRQLRRRQWAGFLAFIVHEVDQHFLVLDQVIIKHNRLPLMGDEGHIGDVVPVLRRAPRRNRASWHVVRTFRTLRRSSGPERPQRQKSHN